MSISLNATLPTSDESDECRDSIPKCENPTKKPEPKKVFV